MSKNLVAFALSVASDLQTTGPTFDGPVSTQQTNESATMAPNKDTVLGDPGFQLSLPNEGFMVEEASIEVPEIREGSVVRAKELEIQGQLNDELNAVAGYNLLAARLEEVRRRMLADTQDFMPLGVYTVPTAKDEAILENITAKGHTSINEDELAERFQAGELMNIPLDELHTLNQSLDPWRRQTYDEQMVALLEEMLAEKMTNMEKFYSRDEKRFQTDMERQRQKIRDLEAKIHSTDYIAEGSKVQEAYMKSLQDNLGLNGNDQQRFDHNNFEDMDPDDPYGYDSGMDLGSQLSQDMM